MPREPLARAQWFFERKIMPFFYAMNFKNQWKVIAVGVFGVFLLASLFLTTFPILNETKESVVKEASKRATFMAKLIAEKNAPFLATHQESKTEIGLAETSEGVKLAVLTDMENRVLAPASKTDSYLAAGGEGVLAVKARTLFKNGRETGFAAKIDDETVVAIEPVKVASAIAGRNVVAGMAIVSIDTSLSTPSLGDDGIVYSETLIITALLGALLLIILYRLTLKPLEVLGDDLDKALKGDLSQVTREFKFEELNGLYDLVNSALQRLPKGEGSAVQMDLVEPSLEEYLGPLRMLGESLKSGVVVFDSSRRVAYLNSIFEEISGIRADSALGQDLASVARDQSLGAFANDLMDRLALGSEGLSEDYEFSGIKYRVKLSAFGMQGQNPRCYLLLAVRGEE
jgi:nitrogen fixation/metabolism regulation signal transduction histidine kinase